MSGINISPEAWKEALVLDTIWRAWYVGVGVRVGQVYHPLHPEPVTRHDMVGTEPSMLNWAS